MKEKITSLYKTEENLETLQKQVSKKVAMDGAKIATIEAQLRDNKKLKIPPQGKQINTDKGGAVVMNNREKLNPTKPRTMVLTNSPPLGLVLGITQERNVFDTLKNAHQKEHPLAVKWSSKVC